MLKYDFSRLVSIHFLTELFERNLIKDHSIFPSVIILLILISFSLDYELISSNFVTNSYGESWDSFCEKSWVPVQNQWVPVKKCLSLYATRQLIWRQTPKLCITVLILKLKYSPSILKYITKAKRNMHH